jgi:hypothetical protein
MQVNTFLSIRQPCLQLKRKGNVRELSKSILFYMEGAKGEERNKKREKERERERERERKFCVRLRYIGF